MLYIFSVILIVLAMFVPMSLVSIILVKKDFDSLVSIDR
jgi:hypothetical protein